METEPFLLDGPQRSVVEAAIKNVCTHRGYALWSVHVRTNHAHVVSYGTGGPKKLMSAFKANSTRELREQRLVEPDVRIWSRGGSGRYLWKDEQVEAAIDYVINGQGDDLPNF
jgi:REP element-mobilizing transposase RayT